MKRPEPEVRRTANVEIPVDALGNFDRARRLIAKQSRDLQAEIDACARETQLRNEQYADLHRRLLRQEATMQNVVKRAERAEAMVELMAADLKEHAAYPSHDPVTYV